MWSIIVLKLISIQPLLLVTSLPLYNPNMDSCCLISRITPELAGKLTWIFIPENNFKIVQNSLPDDQVISQFRYFDHRHCYTFMEILMANIKIQDRKQNTTAICELTTGREGLLCRRTIPVFLGSEEKREELLGNLPEGAEIFRPREVMQVIGTLLDKKLEIDDGIASVKAALCAGSSSLYLTMSHIVKMTFSAITNMKDINEEYFVDFIFRHKQFLNPEFFKHLISLLKNSRKEHVAHLVRRLEHFLMLWTLSKMRFTEMEENYFPISSDSDYGICEKCARKTPKYKLRIFRERKCCDRCCRLYHQQPPPEVYNWDGKITQQSNKGYINAGDEIIGMLNSNDKGKTFPPIPKMVVRRVVDGVYGQGTILSKILKFRQANVPTCLFVTCNKCNRIFRLTILGPTRNILCPPCRKKSVAVNTQQKGENKPSFVQKGTKRLRVDTGSNKNTLEKFCSWERFNTEVLLPWLGYTIESKWQNWESFLGYSSTRYKELWAFVNKQEISSMKDSYIKIEDIDQLLRSILQDQKGVFETVCKIKSRDGL
nr:hypothetical protein BCACJCBH_00053 [White spot syndrome virus]